jgi:hypothetical protein
MLLISSVRLTEFGEIITKYKTFTIKAIIKVPGILNLQSYILIGL